MRSRWMRFCVKLPETMAREGIRRLRHAALMLPCLVLAPRVPAGLDSSVATRALDDSRRSRKPPLALLSARGEPEHATKGSEEGLPPLCNPAARKDSVDECWQERETRSRWMRFCLRRPRAACTRGTGFFGCEPRLR